MTPNDRGTAGSSDRQALREALERVAAEAPDDAGADHFREAADRTDNAELAAALRLLADLHAGEDPEGDDAAHFAEIFGRNGW